MSSRDDIKSYYTPLCLCVHMCVLGGALGLQITSYLLYQTEHWSLRTSTLAMFISHSNLKMHENVH